MLLRAWPAGAGWPAEWRGGRGRRSAGWPALGRLAGGCLVGRRSLGRRGAAGLEAGLGGRGAAELEAGVRRGWAGVGRSRFGAGPASDVRRSRDWAGVRCRTGPALRTVQQMTLNGRLRGAGSGPERGPGALVAARATNPGSARDRGLRCLVRPARRPGLLRPGQRPPNVASANVRREALGARSGPVCCARGNARPTSPVRTCVARPWEPGQARFAAPGATPPEPAPRAEGRVGGAPPAAVRRRPPAPWPRGPARGG
jgi:hypothetical protein